MLGLIDSNFQIEISELRFRTAKLNSLNYKTLRLQKPDFRNVKLINTHDAVFFLTALTVTNFTHIVLT